ncbi:MAG: uracil-DNA glycosylase [bacterium]
MKPGRGGIEELRVKITNCDRCSRLVQWRQKVARDKVRRFADHTYWGKPVPGFGDLNARVLVVGLAPAAHGANRTGRMFTGDRSGDWLYRSLHKFAFASQPQATGLDDGLVLRDCYITASLRCAPPQNKPTSQERSNCFHYLIEEMKLLSKVKVVVALGRLAFDTTVRVLQERNAFEVETRPVFAHGSEAPVNGHLTLLASYHPSQQNTFTGKLTESMFDSVFSRARELISPQAD